MCAVLGAGLVGFGGTASAQEDPTDTPTTESSAPADTSTSSSTSVTEPAPPPKDDDGDFEEIPLHFPPSVSTGSACEGGIGFVDVVVTNPNDTEITYAVNLSKDGASVRDGSVKVAAGDTRSVTFEKVTAGEFEVRVNDGPNIVVSSAASVDRCGEIVEPVDDPLQVFVACENGEGLVTIRVFNTEGESRTYTVAIDDLELPGAIELGANEYTVVVDQAIASDGTYAVRVVAEGIDHTETVKVACAPAPPTSTPPTTSKTPVPQARANQGGLPNTGAAVGGMALLAGVALALGGGLVIAARRRRTAESDSTES